MISPEQISEVLKAIDDANVLDPNIELDKHGEPQAKEYLYSQRMSDTLEEFASQASRELRIAVHGHHIERWTSPRDRYPMDRAGYKRWRSELMLFHASRIREIMAAKRCEEASIERVEFLIKKRKLRQDEETQCFEDIICLTFLAHYFDEFAEKHPEEKIIDIVQKTWKKMSPKGHEAALLIPYSPSGRALVEKALEPN